MSKKPQPELALRHCLVGPGLALVSRHTGRQIIENLSATLFLIPESWTQEGGKTALSSWETAFSPTAHREAFPPAALEQIEALGSAKSKKAFAARLDALLHAVFVEKRHGVPLKSRAGYIELLASLWALDCLIWPSGESVAGWSLPQRISKSWGKAQPLAERALNHWIGIQPDRIVSQSKMFFRLMLSHSCVENTLDIIPRYDAKPLEKRHKENLSRATRMIVAWQREDAPAIRHFDCADFTRGGKPKPGCRSDPEFGWATLDDSSWEAWRTLAAEHLAEQRRSRHHVIGTLNSFLDYAKRQSIPREPAAFFQAAYRAPDPGLRSDRRIDTVQNAKLEIFLTFAMSKSCARRADDGFAYVDSSARIPFSIPKSATVVKPVETHRQPMPERLTRLCVQILTENDFAWPKAFQKGTGSSDWFIHADRTTGEKTKVWSPVRACVVLAKLMLPSRTIQIRMLDSGEADSQRYDPIARAWAENAGPLASAKRVEKGVFRHYKRDDGSSGALLHFNTNKTSDIDADPRKRGYVMPWEHQEALELFAMLRDWQERHNPIATPTRWADVPELRNKHRDTLVAMGSACFLFRDPMELDKTIPISDAKVINLWRALMEEAEKRLAKLNERLPNGDPIKLVLSYCKKRPSRLAYDLHSLRVTVITALYQNGVDIGVLMKIAGHATAIMTFYYVKESVEKISLELAQANARGQQPDAALNQWDLFLKDQARAEPRPIALGGSTSSEKQIARVIMMDYGFCPVGATRCSDSGGQSKQGRDCAQCAHFATGPAFLPGLQAECDERLARALVASQDYQATQAKRDQLNSIRVKALREAAPFSEQRKLDAADAALERCSAVVDDASRSLRAVVGLARQCAALALAPEENRLALIMTPTGLQSLRRPCVAAQKDDLLIAIGQTASLYEAAEERINEAALRRMRFLNSALAEHGDGRRFGFLDDLRVQASVASQAMRLALLRAGSTGRACLSETALRLIAAPSSAPKLLLEGPPSKAVAESQSLNAEDA
ncbi:VPA1269 family protein [Pseudoduganella aquatica]|uniref:Uncharacterized protein n=1 Tax=Pseudoduganella aquatica TaxID=2660641 RepID=A0A7X4HHR8_9BURK|nr:VPA1269 family protein [Pseudoduganella aquatica]MYN11239.1 hypothetical protein [Pseudoduganella aquatica]